MNKSSHNSHRFPARRAVDLRIIIGILSYLIDCWWEGRDPGYGGKLYYSFCDDLSHFFFGSSGGRSVALATGTSAIYIALKSLRLKNGGIVHVSPITDPGSISAIIQAGFRVDVLDTVSVDSGETSHFSLEERVSEESVACLLVHHAGWPSDSHAFLEICNIKGIKLIEDFSQSIGATIRNDYVGTIGHISASSTMHKKTLITGGCGGIILTQCEELHEHAMQLMDRGKPVCNGKFSNIYPDGNSCELPGLNLQLDEISLRVGVGSLKRLRESVSRRLGFVVFLKALVSDLNVKFPDASFNSTPSPFLVPLTFPSTQVKLEVERVFLDSLVPCNPDYRFLVSEWDWVKSHLTSCSLTPNAKSYLERTIFLYINENYHHSEARYIARLLHSQRELLTK